jgi:hypothetical protein
MPVQPIDPETAIDYGTLLWVGDRDSEVYRDAYRFCDSHVSQLAHRPDLRTAITRPSSAVRTIVCCRENDSAEALDLFRMICRLHDQANAFLLLGPLCAGSRPSPSETFEVPSIRWHEWESLLPAHLRRCGWANQSVERPQSIAVVASSYANASALLAIAASGQASAVWSRPHQLSSLRCFDEIWWDDSSTSGADWAELLNRQCLMHSRHIWVSGDLTPQSKRAAIDAGVGLVIAKPGDFSLLIDRVTNQSLDHERRAA